MGSLRDEFSVYEILQPYKIDIEKVNRLYQSIAASAEFNFGMRREYCELIMESSDYNFYSYRSFPDGSGGDLLRQNKKDPSNVVYFGEHKTFNCIFHGYLFQVNGYSDIGGIYYILQTNITTGAQKKLKWFGKGRILSHHLFCQDSVTAMSVKNDELVLSVHRIKETLENMLEVFGDRRICICREISKIHEEVSRGKITDLLEFVDSMKGEFVIVVEGDKTVIDYSGLDIIDHVKMYCDDGMSEKDAIKLVAKERNVAKSIVYSEYHNRK